MSRSKEFESFDLTGLERQFNKNWLVNDSQRIAETVVGPSGTNLLKSYAYMVAGRVLTLIKSQINENYVRNALEVATHLRNTQSDLGSLAARELVRRSGFDKAIEEDDPPELTNLVQGEDAINSGFHLQAIFESDIRQATIEGAMKKMPKKIKEEILFFYKAYAYNFTRQLCDILRIQLIVNNKASLEQIARAMEKSADELLNKSKEYFEKETQNRDYDVPLWDI